MQVKICGITTPADARTAQDAGADFVGLVFVERRDGTRSRRFVNSDDARAIVRALDGRAKPVGLFQNHPLDHVAQTAAALELTVVQLHGDETAPYMNELLARRPECRIIKAVSVTGPDAIRALPDFYRAIRERERIVAFLLDAPGGGGMGHRFDWHDTAAAIGGLRKDLPAIFLAGGLDPENVAEAIRIMKPDGVDVSSGVEAAPGIKDPAKVRRFIELARQG